ncbi:tripartite motif-containing protein 14 [Mauremys reevesii]|uniref:tripartite motif-containing protein 14 n=1 Tax=Mauremys reevesii TaxID=260615 RepID=UPI00193EC475|nr:tripartite motif-containing protein 14 [Mauremys reevesii]
MECNTVNHWPGGPGEGPSREVLACGAGRLAGRGWLPASRGLPLPWGRSAAEAGLPGPPPSCGRRVSVPGRSGKEARPGHGAARVRARRRGPRGAGPRCELCPAGAAEWSCLTCLASYCGAHVRPHLGEPGGAPAFRGHRLGPAGEAAAELRALRERGRWCPEHRERPLELFCADCALCVCALCPVLGAHRGHRVSLVGQAAQGTKEFMTTYLKELELKKNQEVGNIRHIEQAVNDLKAHASASKASLAGKFTELRLLLDEEERLTKKFINEKTQRALMMYEQQTETCQERIQIIESFSDRVRQIQQRSDPIQLLQDYTASEKEIQQQRAPAEQWHPVPMSFEHVMNHYRGLARAMQSVLQKPLEARLKEDIFSSLNATSKKEPGALLKTTSTVDRSLFLKHARSPTLEYDSVHPRLSLSEDRLTVSCSWRRKFYPSSPQRFDKLWQVLSKDAFFSGSHYWEVDVLHAGQGWWIGAAYPSIKRHGDSETCRLGWNRASWCIKRFDLEYWAFHKGERTLILIDDDPERIGVFLDYEAGILSFYNVTDGMVHLHTFRCKFTEPLYPALRLWEGAITICKLT